MCYQKFPWYTCCSNKGTTGGWNVRAMNQDIFHVALEILRFSIDIIGTGKLKWAGMSHFSSEKHFLFREEKSQMKLSTSITNTWLSKGSKFPNSRTIQIRNQTKPISITMIRVFSCRGSYEDLQRLINMASYRLQELPRMLKLKFR